MQEAKKETIGKVVLDLTWYPGKDLYTDGAVEERLLKIVQSHTPEEYNAAIREEKDWAVLYHLSHIRENILSAFAMDGTEQVLEVGSGCGAVTGALLSRAAGVTGVDLSRRRSQINAWRHRDAANLSILVGNFRDIEPNLPRKYDVITLIGVFEYAKAYIGTKEPYEEFIRLLLPHLAEGGRLVIAIENRLGLKYFAGASEDHTGAFFEGVEGYPDPDTMVRTFSRAELEAVFERAGAGRAQFYYPYPDYKLPMAVYSDAYLPRAGELTTNIWNFDRRRLVLFEEGKAFDSLSGEGQFPAFSNSFLAVLTPDGKGKNSEEDRMPVYSRFSNERALRFDIRTDILKAEDGTWMVRKTACYPQGRQHVLSLAQKEAKLNRQLSGSGIRANRVLTADADDGSVSFEYLPGRQTLEERVRELIRDGRREEGFALVRSFAGRVCGGADRAFTWTPEFEEVFGEGAYPWEDAALPVTDLDAVCENLLSGEGEEEDVLIDYEWTYEFPIPVRFLKFRIWDYFFRRVLPEESAALLCGEEGFTQEEISRFTRMEQSWQRYILGGHTPLRELYAQITPGCVELPGAFAARGRAGGGSFESSLEYSEGERTDAQAAGGAEDRAKGSAPEQTVLKSGLRLEEDGSFRVCFELSGVPSDACLRWHPLENRLCSLKIGRIRCGELVIPEPENGSRGEGDWDMFWTTDPVYRLRMRGDAGASRAVSGPLVIEGQLRLIDPYQELAQISALQRERDAYYQEMESLRARLGAMRATKAFQAAEGLRRVRNFTMARVRGTKLFRDKNAGPKKYQEWLALHQADEETLRIQSLTQLPGAPLLSVLVPVYRTPERYLRAMLDSVLAQSYQNWELCLAEASGDGGATEAILSEYTKKDARIRVKVLEENEGISGNTNRAAQMASGEYLALLDHDDLLAPDALFEAARAIVRERADVLYTDEDKVNMLGTDHFEPNLKPDFSPDLLRAHNYITHLFIVKRSLFEQVGGFRAQFDGAQDYDLILRCCHAADKIFHIPRILYHWRSHESSTAGNPKSKLYAYEAGRRAIEENLKVCGIPAKVERSRYWGLNHVRYQAREGALVSILIPNKDHTEDLDRCLRSILEKNTYPDIEILIIENNSTDSKTFAYYRRIREAWPQVRVLRWEKEFNYAAINNFGASQARGELLLLLNNDTQLIGPDSIAEMAGLCSREDVGCVGAKLLYADDTVQHAGIVLGFGGFAGHVFVGIGKDSPGFMMRPLVTCNYSAVTGACLMVRRELYRKAGGLDERFAVALNDVDFCLRIRELGKVNVYTPYSLWRHYESRSRGYEDTPQKKARLEREAGLFRERWAQQLAEPDPYYNPNFELDKAPFSLW